jgi:hypothetical protein
MLSMITLLGGGLLRLLPELFAFFNKKTDNAHELAMLEKQYQLEQTKAAQHFEEVRYSGDMSETLSLLEAHKEALKGQMQVTGVKWVDASNFFVRPFYAYTALLLYYMSKLALFCVALQQSGGVWEKVAACYTTEDFAFLSGICSFYFVGRTIEKIKGK